MRIVTKARQERAERRVRLLREQLAEARQELAVQSAANGRLAARAEQVQAELEHRCGALTASHRDLIAQRDRLQQQVAALQADLDLAARPDKKLALTIGGAAGQADAA